MSGTLATEISVFNVKKKENEENIAFFLLVINIPRVKNRTFSFLFLVPTVMTFAVKVHIRFDANRQSRF
jgi:hypothetical protein